MIANLSGYVFKLFWVSPNLVKKADVGRREGGLVHFVDQIRYGVALLVPKIHRCKAVQRHIGSRRFFGLHASKLLHWSLAAVRFERCFASHPISTLFSDGSLGQLIAELNFKFAAVQATFPIRFGNVELTTFLLHLVSDLVCNKRW